MRSEGLCVRRLYTNLSDSQLDISVRSILRRHPHVGYRMKQACLITEGLRLPEHRVRASLERVDPTGIAIRWSQHRCIHRRVNYAPHPNVLWHIDGNMALVRWRLVIHGGIDSFSRLITYLQCSNNNRASTVLCHFIHGARMYGYPSRVRSDRGGENYYVAQVMLCIRGTGRWSHITWRFTRNQRIERLWRDVYQNYICLLFYMLEDANVLDPIALHYIFLPRIRQSLQSFKSAWNSHGLSSAQNSSPLQLWTRGTLMNKLRCRAVDEIFSKLEVSNDDSETSDDNDSDTDPDIHQTENLLQNNEQPLMFPIISFYTSTLSLPPSPP